MKKYIFLFITSCLLFCVVNAQPVSILNVNKISATSGNFNGLGPDFRTFGGSFSPIGDLDKDGITDIAVRAVDGAAIDGVVFILFMNANQTVKSHSIIGRNLGGLNGTFGNMQSFGNSIVSFGDLDGDGVGDLLVGNSAGAGNTRGELFVLFMNTSGTVKTHQIIGPDQLPLSNNASLGSSACLLGDINKDGKVDIAVWSNGNDGGAFNGIIHIISLNNNGTLNTSKKISSTSGNFNGTPSFGFFTTTCIGDLNQDSVQDLVVTSGNLNELWVLFLDTSGTVKSHQRIAQGVGGYTDTIGVNDVFGQTLAKLGDMDGDGVIDIGVSSNAELINGQLTGRVRILFMNSNGTVKSIKRIDYNTPNFNDTATDNDRFGSALAGLIDINGDFKNDLIIGAPGRDEGDDGKGAIYLLSMDGAVHPTPPVAQWRVNATSGNQNTVFSFTQYSSGFPSSYKWRITPNTYAFQNNTTDTSANPVVKFTQNGTYSVQLSVTNPFASDSLLRSNYITIQTVGLHHATSNGNSITLYPNPATTRVQVQSPQSMQAIYVYDIAGKLLLHHTPQATADELNLTALAPGLYTIHVITETGTASIKLMKN